MKRAVQFVIAGLALSLATSAAGQGITTPNGGKSDATTLKIHQIDLLVQLLPLAIRKDQFNPLLSALEHARSDVRRLEAAEDADLAKIDGEVSDAVNNALEKGVYPPKEMQLKWAKLYRDMGLRRQIDLGVITSNAVEALEKVFDAGQVKVMENSLDPYAMDPSIKKDSLDKDGKIRFFVNMIMLDNSTYDLLVKLHEKAG